MVSLDIAVYFVSYINNIFDIYNFMNILPKTADVNDSCAPLTQDEWKFIRQFASLLAPRGLSPSAGLVYAYLVLRQKPVSVDQIANDLEMSRVGAWNSARSLETFEHVTRYGVSGSKRVLYASSNNFGAPLLKQAALLGEVGELLQHCVANFASAEAAPELQERANFYFSMKDALEKAIVSFNASRT